MDLISQLANPSNALITLFYCLKFFPPIDRSTPVEWWLQQAAAMWWGLLSSNWIGRLGRIENIKRPSIGKVALKVIFIKTAKNRNDCVLPSLLLLFSNCLGWLARLPRLQFGGARIYEQSFCFFFLIFSFLYLREGHSRASFLQKAARYYFLTKDFVSQPISQQHLC